MTTIHVLSIGLRMPRGPRLDAPGALHHVLARGIERLPIFRDDHDRFAFLCRLAPLLLSTRSVLYAWALVGNHIHSALGGAHRGILS